MCSQGHRENRMKMVFTKLNNHLMSTSSEMSMFNRLLNHAESIRELVCVFLNVKSAEKQITLSCIDTCYTCALMLINPLTPL